MIKSPFPYFGGKSKVADVVWQRFGDVDHYVEPFAGSLAVLLGRPGGHTANAETVNDLDNYLCNFWRAVQAEPDAVARWADWPVNETDLHARHAWLVTHGRDRLINLDADPMAYDPQVAGWWLWGICSWIGGGWCSGNGPWRVVDGKLVKAPSNAGQGINRQRPHLGNAGRGINRQRPHLGNAGRGINRQLPHLGDAGRGINRQRPHLGNSGQGIKRQLPHLGDAGQGINRKRQDIYVYMRALAERLRHVRVCCGDWQRIVTAGALSHGASVGVFLDPPYSAETGRDMSLYNHESDVSAAVRAWALENGDNPRYRIALCGYEGEHDMPGWHVYKWTARAAYKSSRGDLTKNRNLERIWFSPGCLHRTPGLWDTDEP